MPTKNDPPEPWLRGPIEGVHALVAPLFYTFAQVREDLPKHIEGLTHEQVWRKLDGACLGFTCGTLPAAWTASRLTWLASNSAKNNCTRFARRRKADRMPIRFCA